MAGISMNFASAKLATPPTGTTGLTFSVAAGKGALFTAPGVGEWFYGIFTNAAKSAFEIVKITARSGDTFTIEAGGRGKDGTAAATWVANDVFYFGLTRIFLNELLAQTAFATSLLDDPDAVTARATLEVDSHHERNVLLNGSLQYWPEGTSFAAAASGTYPCENVQYRKSGAMVHTLSRDSDVPSVAQAGYRIPYSLRAQLTTADSSIAAGDFCVIEQFIEGQKFGPYWQRTLTFHVWVKMPISGTFCMYAQNGGLDRSFVGEFTVSASNTWERKKVTLVASPATGTWDFTTGVGLRVGITLAAGTTYQGTAGVWSTGQFFASGSQVNAVNTGLGDVRIADLRLAPGTTPEAMPMERISEVIAEAARYFTIFGGSEAANVGYIPGGSVTSSGGNLFGNFPVPMRVAPTFVHTLGPGIVALNANNTGAAASSLGAACDVKSFNIGVTVATTPWVPWEPIWLRCNTGGGVVKFDARFT